MRVEVHERDLQRRIKRAGGRWDPDAKLWELRYDQALALGLKKRIVKKPNRAARR